MHASSTEDKIHSLEKEYGELHQQLELAIQNLRHYGNLPPQEIVQQCEQVQKTFVDLRNSLIQLAQKIAETREALDRKPERLQNIKTTLARVQQIVHKEQADFPPLRECQAMAAQLNRQIEQSGIKLDGVDHLAGRLHPFFDLLLLLEQAHSLEDVVWQKLRETISRNFGDALALAVVRGKLQLPQKEPSVTTSGPISSEPAISEVHLKPIHPKPMEQVQITTLVSSSAVSSIRVPEEPVKRVVPHKKTSPPPEAKAKETDETTPLVPSLVKPPAAGRSRRMIRNELMRILKSSGDVPAFSPSAQKLLELTDRHFVNFKEIADVVKMDPGLTSRYLRLANSPAFGGQDITDVVQALFRLGFVELRKLAMSVEILKHFSHFRVPVDWNQFWLHSLLTSRLTGVLAGLFHSTDGKEYVLGLLHDIGKLFIGHYFPDQFDEIMLRVSKTNCSFYEAEQEILDITHPEIGAILCEKWRFGADIARAIRYHHTPGELFEKFPDLSGPVQVMTVCVHVASGLANSQNANIPGGWKIELRDFESSSEWELLRRFTPKTKLDFDIMAELQKAHDSMQALIASTTKK